MNHKKETPVSVVARRSLWTKVQRGLAVPLLALLMVGGLLLLMSQPLTTAAAATQPTTTAETSTSGATPERAPTANILYVTATANGTLCTIADPCALQDAVDAAANGDEIHVAAGLYDDVVGNGAFTQTVQINKSITLRGGYDSANWLAEPDPIAHETILDGLGQGRVIYIFAASPTIEGFTIRNGNAPTGGGIYKVTIQGSIIRNNRFYSNTVTASGTQSGGAIATQGADTIVDNVIYDNYANANGGGIFVDNQSSSPVLIQYNRIYNNDAGATGGSTQGGGIYVFNGPATIDGNEIFANRSNFGGGIGVSNQTNANALIQNNLIYNNQSFSGGAGGGILNGGTTKLIHNTIVDNNSVTTGGGGIYVAAGSVFITNTIVASNTAPSNSGIFLASGSVTGSLNNIHNNGSNVSLPFTIIENPHFASYPGDNFHLSANSTALLNAALSTNITNDVDGQVRPFNGGSDVGADEFYDPSFTCFARVNDGPILTNLQSAVNSVTQASDIIKVAGRCRGTGSQVVQISQSLIMRGGYTTTDWVNQDYGPTIIDAQGVSGRRGILITGGSPILDALHITGGNLPSGNGSGVYVSGGTGASLTNLVLFGNSSSGTNGALGLAGGTIATVEFNTLTGNTGAAVRFEGTGAIHNSIIYNNTSTITGGSGHSYNLINVNPLFVNAAANDYHLTLNSPAIAYANPNASLSRDFEGDTRPRASHFSAGADEANQYPGPSLEPSYSDEVDRGTVVAIEHTLSNLGTQTDTFTLTGDNSLNWAIDFPTSSGLLQPGESIQVTVVITVPGSATAQQVGVTVITATSAVNTNVKDTAIDTLTVAQLPGLAFTPTYSNSLLPGEAITYTHTLTNTGDYSDTFTVEIANDPFGWAELLPDNPFDIALGAGESTPVQVVVTVPPFAAAGFANTIIIQATSNYSLALTALVTDTVTAKPTVGTRYVSTIGFDLNNNCTQATDPCRTIGQAVSQASFGDAIRIASGTYAEADITVNDTMSLSGGWTNDFTAQVENPALTVVDATQTARIFTIAPGVAPEFSNITLKNGFSSAVGGAVQVGGGAQPTFTQVYFEENSSPQGAAIYAEANAQVNLFSSRLSHNIASRNGGGFYMVSGSALVSGTTFIENQANGTQSLEGGGAIYQLGGTLNVVNSLLTDNSSARHGGAIFVRGGQTTINFTTLVGNAAAGSGGAFYQDNGTSTFTNNIVSDNTGVTGGAMYRSSGTLNNDYNLFWNNLPNNSNVTLGSHSILGNPDFADPAYRLSPNSMAVDGGNPAATVIVDFEGDPRPADSGFDMGYDELAGCLAKRGSVIYASIQEAIDAGTGGDLIQVSGICRGVQPAVVTGGATVSQTIYLTQSLTIEGGWDSAFTTNEPPLLTFVDSQGLGRGLYIDNAAAPEIRNLFFINGTAANFGGGPGGQSAGGGVYVTGSDAIFGQVAIKDSSAQVGGGLYVTNGSLDFSGGALISNTATFGAGLYNDGATASIANGIVVHNMASNNGGGLYSISGVITVTNIALGDNAAATGAGIYLNSGTATLLHLTFYANAATGNGGGFYQNGGTSILRSTIFESNTATSGPAIFRNAGTLTVDYNYYYNHATTPVVGTAAGANSVTTNSVPPGMIDPVNDDFHLLDDAAALDIADPNSPITYDLELDPRPSNQGFDMGADELAGCYARVDNVIYGSIQYAIQIADPGATIDVAGRCMGVHTFDAGGSLGVINTTVHITKNVKLVGGWRDDFSEQDDITYIDAVYEGYALFFAPGITTTVENFHILHGNGNAPGMNGNGGAIYIQNASPQIMGNDIYSNTATTGSAVYISNASPTIGGGNRVYSNTVTNGTIYVNNTGATAFIVNNFILDNVATNGAGVYHLAGLANIWHNDFIANEATGAGGAVYVAAASPSIRNNILTGNEATTTGGIRCNTGATPVISYNNYFNNINGDVGGAACTTGTGSLFVDPLFVSPIQGNYDLQDDSPLIDVGDPAMTLLVDHDEHIRPSHQGFDIGAYEMGGCFARNLADSTTIYGSVQRAVDLANNGDTIEVDGTCLGVNVEIVSGNPITQNLFIDKNVSLDGSWESGLPGSTSGLASLQPEGEGRVVYVASGRTVSMTNFFMVNGDANGAGLSNNGGGVYNTGDLTLNTVTIRLSVANNGAGVYNVGPLTIIGSFIQENTAGSGGGVYNNYAGLTLITGTQLSLNIATVSGAGLYQNLGTLQAEGNEIFSNVASINGSGVFQNAATLHLLRNKIYSNSASSNGGGVYLNAAATNTQIYNNFIYANQAVTGAGLYNATTSSGIWHNTFVDNAASGGNGGGLFTAGGNPSIRNNIVHDNTGTGIHATGGGPVIGYNNVVGNSGAGYGGTASDSGGGIAQAPNYVNAAANDYHLKFGSPGIDVGDPASPVGLDIDGDERPNNDEFDMGADELNACLIRVGTAIFYHLQDAIDYAESNNIRLVEIARGECRGVRLDPVTNTTLQVGYVRENIHFIGGLSRIDFSDPDDFHEFGFNSTAINAEGEGRVIHIAGSATVTFTHVALVNGNAFAANDGNDNGGGLYNPSGNVETTEANICSSEAQDGGGYYAGTTSTSDLGGAVIGRCRVAVINDDNELIGLALYLGNNAANNGGGIFNQGTLEMRNIGVYLNSAGNHGGGIYNTSAAALLVNVVNYDNTAGANGGGLYNTGNNLSVYHNTIRNNDAANGGGIFNSGNGFILNSTILYSNTASTTGGGLHSTSGTLAYNNFNANTPNDSTIGTGSNVRLGDPGFATLAVFSLRYTSGNIDEADPSLILPPISILVDANLDTRPDNSPPHNGLWEYRSDIGADEYSKEFSCEILPESQTQSGGAGNVVYHLFAVTNDGTFTDSITVTLESSSQGWATIIGGNEQSLLLEPFQTEYITVSVAIPVTATTNLVDTSIVSCDSRSLPGDGDTGVAVTQVELVQGVQVEYDQFAFALPGEVLTFTHIITNTGNQTENVQIIPNSGPQFANAVLLNPDGSPFFPDTIPLDAGEAITLLLRVTIFTDAMGGGVASPGVVARLAAAPTIFDAAQDTITIGYVPGTRYVAANGAVDNSNCTNPNNPCATLQHAISQAQDADAILLSVGTYTAFVTRTVGIEVVSQNAFVDKDVTIVGGYNAGDGYTTYQPITNSVILDGQDVRRVLYITPGTTVTLQALFLDNGRHEDRGGAVYNAGGDLTVLGSWIRSSWAQYGGGLFHATGNLTLNSTVIADNLSRDAAATNPGEGAGVFIASGTAVLENNTFVNNRNSITNFAPTGNGGALFQGDGSLTLLNNIFAQNFAQGQGGAYYISPTVTIQANDYSLFFGNTPEYGNVPTGTNSLTADPLFSDTYYHLGGGSPAIDAGSAAVTLGLDMDGEARQQGIAVDLGADEKTQVATFAFVPTFQSALINSGGQHVYTHVLTNTGDFADSYTLAMGHSTTGGTWSYDLTPTSTGVLDPGDSIQVTLVVTGTGPGYVDTTVITATSDASSLAAAVTDQTTISQTAGVDIEPDRTGSGFAGDTLTYTHTVTNTGDGPDSFDLSVANSNPSGWSITIVPTNTGTLLPNEAAAVTVTIQVPLTATVAVHTATIQATSVVNPAVSDSVTDTTNLTVAGIRLEPDGFTVVDAGTVVTYSHILTNTGNITDTITLTATTSLGWLVSFEPISVTLAPLATAPVTVVISVPVAATAGQQDDTVITATSSFNPFVFDTATDSTRVTQNHGLLFTPNLTQTVPANTTVIYTHILTNTGDGPDTFAITTLSSLGWTVQTPANITLNPQTSATVLVTLTVPATTPVTDTMWVTATSVISPAFAATVTDVTIVTGGGGGTAGVVIAPDNTGSDVPGANLTYQHIVTNTGTIADTINLSVVSSQGWTVAVNPTSVALNAGASQVVTVSVAIPGSATPGTQDVATVTASSTISPSVTDAATDTTTVLNSGAGVLIGPNHTGNGPGGTDVIYTHWVTNTGSAADFITLNASSTQGWTVIYEPTFFNLAAGASAPLTVTVSIPATAPSGTVDVTTIRAQSTNNTSVFDTAVNTTTVGIGVGNGIFMPLLYTPCTPTGIDLVVTSLELIPANPQPGQTVTVRVTIRNQGTVNVGPTNNFYLDFYDNVIPAPNTPGAIAWGVQGVWMTAGASRTFSGSYTFTAGTHQLYAQVDTDRSVNECPNENNNVLGPISLVVNSLGNGPAPVLTPIAPTPLDLPRATPTPARPE